MNLIEAHPKWNAEVVYGDTDSVFVHLPGRSKEEAFRIGKVRDQVVVLGSATLWSVCDRVVVCTGDRGCCDTSQPAACEAEVGEGLPSVYPAVKEEICWVHV